jgi:hypothetical protein
MSAEGGEVDGTEQEGIDEEELAKLEVSPKPTQRNLHLCHAT